MSKYQKEIAEEFAKKVKNLGFTVYMAKEGTYGIVTDYKEERVLCFGVQFGMVHLSGNYKSKNNGTGWRITDDVPDEFNHEYIKRALYANSPFEFIRYATLEEHSKKYQSSSKYKLFEAED